MVEALIKRGDLDEADARDLDGVGEAIAAAAAGGKADVPVTWPGSLLVAECVEEVL